jgi:PQQ-dependent catabolism-associated beta-propeller protein
MLKRHCFSGIRSATKVLTLCLIATQIQAADYLVYASNEDSNELSIIDPDNNESIGTIAVGKRPRGVRVSPDGAKIYVALSGSPKCPPSMPDSECEKLIADKTADGIAVIDAITRKVERVLPGGSDPEQFDLSPDQSRLFIANEDQGTATIVDIASGVVVKETPVGREPEGVKVSPDGSVFLVTGESEHDVSVVDSASGEVLHRVKVGLRPRDIIFTPDGRHAIVSAEANHQVDIIDMETHTVARTIKLAEGVLPMGLALAPDGRVLYVANGRAKTVSKIDFQNGAALSSIEVGTRPWGIALSPDGKRLFTANGPSNDVTVIDTETFTVMTRIPVGKSPWGVAIGPSL